MGSRAEKLLVAGLLALVVVVAMLAAPGDEQSVFDPRTSSYRWSPYGARALYHTLEELGIPVGRRLTPFAGADSLRGPLVVLAPSTAPLPEEMDRLARWVEAGGTLFYVPGGDPLADTLGLVVVQVLEEDGDHGDVRAARPRPHPWTAGVDSVAGFAWAFADTSPALRRPESAVLLAVGRQPTAVVVHRGKGTVVAFSATEPLANLSLRESGAAPVFARAVAALANGRRVWFDEYHHGYEGNEGTGSATGRFLREHPLGHAFVQLGLAGLALLLLHGRRLGAAVPPPAPRRRSPLEHVEALAGAYRQAGARRTARRLLLAGLARRLGRRVPRDPQEEHEMIRRLAALPAGQEAAQALDDEWKKGERADLAVLSASVDRLLDEVRRP